MRRMFQGAIASADGATINDARHWVLSAASPAALRALCSSRVISSPRAPLSAKASSTYGFAHARSSLSSNARSVRASSMS